MLTIDFPSIISTYLLNPLKIKDLPFYKNITFLGATLQFKPKELFFIKALSCSL